MQITFSQVQTGTGFGHGFGRYLSGHGIGPEPLLQQSGWHLGPGGKYAGAHFGLQQLMDFELLSSKSKLHSIIFTIDYL